MAETAVLLNKFCLILLIILVHLNDVSFGALRNLQKSEFRDFVKQGSYVIVLFRSKGECEECTKAADLLDKLPQPELLDTEIQKVFVEDDSIAERYGATSYPSIVFFRKGYPALYDGLLDSPDDIPELAAWVESAIDIATKELYEDSFEHLTQAATGATTGDWFVLFYDAGCECCEKALPAVESAAIRQKYRMNFAKVDVVENNKLAIRFKITEQPTSYLFKQGKMYKYEPNKYDPQSLIAFVDSWYKNVKAIPVLTEQTAFDALTENIADYLKENLNDPGKRWIVIGPAVLIVILIVLILTCVSWKSDNSRPKYD